MKSLPTAALILLGVQLAFGQTPPPAAAPPAARPGQGAPRPAVISPEVSPDRHITFRISAPKAESVRLSAGDIPGNGQGVAMTKGTNGVWEATIGPVDPGSYRYQFNVDGVMVIDPRSPATSESNNNTWSLVNVSGSDFMDAQDVPHGAVATINYYSKSLQKFRRMHVYTPPGYELGKGKFPVFYLLHGAGDCDDSWTSVGRAGYILDNLIAAKKAKPMLMVMPAGHIRATGFGGRGAAPAGGGQGRPPVDEFTQDFMGDIMPFIEKNYRVYTDRPHRAIAGLSMGGAQTLNIAIPNLEKIGYFGVYSSGVFGIAGGGRGGAPGAATGPTFEEQHKDILDNAKLKKDLKLVWFATGKDDFLIETSRGTVAMLKKHGFNPVFIETTGGHTWVNWRNYLNEFAPLLFQ